MVKGCQRQIVLLRGTGSGLFEEAYFILKPEKAAVSEQLMIAEANRIIEENALHRPSIKRRRRSVGAGLREFFIGLAAGSGLMGLLWLLLG